MAQASTIVLSVAGLIALAAIIASLTGYGRVAMAWLRPDRVKDGGLSLAVGIAVFSVAAGGLEIGCSASPVLMVAVIGLGLLLLISRSLPLSRRRLRAHSIALPVAVLPVAVLPVAVLTALLLIDASVWDYHFIDDRMGYLVFPRRILQQGCIGRDPFQFRRVEVGLGGGGAYLVALLQSLVGVSQTRLADIGLGGICLLLLVDAHARELGLAPSRRALALLAALAVIVFSPIINNTPETLGKAMLYALLRAVTLTFADPPSVRRAVLLAVLFCALALLKTSYLPVPIGVVAAFYGLKLLTGLTMPLAVEAGCGAALVLTLLLPWMLVTHEIAGTFWYPLLGTGTLGNAETAGLVTLPHFVRDGGRLTAILLPACLAAWLEARRAGSRSPSIIVAVPLIAVLLTLLAQTKFTIFGYRYGEMGPATVFLFYVTRSLRPSGHAGWWRSAERLGSAAVLLLLAANNTLGHRWFYDGRFAQWLEGRPAEERLTTAGTPAYQLAVPKGKPLLVLVTWPSLLDFGRNRVSVMDWPGMIGPPGMPELDDPLAWRDYLVRAGLDEFAYSYADQAGYTDPSIAADIARYQTPAQYSRYQIDLSEKFRAVRHMAEAMRSCGTPAFDDGIVAVIALRSIASDCLRHARSHH